MKKLLITFFLLPLISSFAFAIDGKSIEIGKCYIFRLTTGDVIEGMVQSFEKDEDGEGISFESEIGVGSLYFFQIVEAIECSKYYKYSHKYFLLPTAVGIGKNHFVGLLEMFFLYAGTGITDYFSITAGRSLLPFAYSNQQISLINVKGSLPKVEFEDIFRELHLAFGGNIGFANNNNRFIHFYGVATALFFKTSLSASLFYKMGTGDLYTIRYGVNSIDVNYPDGSFGIALGVDSRLPNYREIHIIGELWNIDVARPTNSGLFIGLRFANAHFCSDFGIAWFTQPFVVPIVNFVWTPF
ncbi:MAG: hypothetical protein CH6_4203 [Candidatus Kapaibacterium sp.]|nr:MAG: hypothetical protein CH6_4203 [Candidatus Kapabacteria bacterium]